MCTVLHEFASKSSMYYYSVPSEEKQQDMSLSISTNGNASITVSVEVNGTIYSGLYGGGVIKCYIFLIINNVLSTLNPSVQDDADF